MEREQASADNQDHNRRQRPQKCFNSYSKYTLDQSFYLNKNLPPEGWKMSSGRAKIVIKGLQQNKELRDRYKDAYKEIESFLKDQKKKDDKQQLNAFPESCPQQFPLSCMNLSCYLSCCCFNRVELS